MSALEYSDQLQTPHSTNELGGESCHSKGLEAGWFNHHKFFLVLVTRSLS